MWSVQCSTENVWVFLCHVSSLHCGVSVAQHSTHLQGVLARGLHADHFLALRLMYTNFCGGPLFHMLPRQIGYHLLLRAVPNGLSCFLQLWKQVTGCGGGKEVSGAEQMEERGGEEGEEAEEGVVNRA